MSVVQFVAKNATKFEDIETEFLRNYNQTMEAMNILEFYGKVPCVEYLNSLAKEDKAGVTAMIALIQANGVEEISKMAKKYAAA